MKLDWLDVKGTWAQVKRSARNTIGKEGPGIEPTSLWKKRLLLSEHSPIRKLLFDFRWSDLPFWVSVHFVRHKFGCEHWVTTERSDRTGVNRDTIGQGAFVKHESEDNAQALITISRKRLCMCASPETRQAWKLVKAEVALVEPEVAFCMVRNCIYQGWCYEWESCGYHLTPAFEEELRLHREGINVGEKSEVK